jgi:YbbR domain-containing protein
VKQKFSAAFRSRAFYIIFSVLASVVLWLYVEYIENPEATWTVSGIPVEYINSDVVTDRQLIISDFGAETVTITFSGKRGAVSKVNSHTVRAVVNLSQITSQGQNMLRYSEEYGEGLNTQDFSVVSRSVSYITMQVEAIHKAEKPVTVVYNGTITAEGYHAEPAIVSFETIMVSGPKSVVDSIAALRVEVLRENLTKTVTENLQFTPVDEDGRPVNTASLSFSADTVSVTIPVKMTKEMPLTVKLIYGAGAKEDNTSVTITPSSVTLSGETELLNFNYIQLATVDLTSFETGTTLTKTIVLPEGVVNLTGITEATVEISISGLETAKFTADNIQIINETQGYTAELITESLEITVRGAPRELALVSPEKIRVTADLSGLGDTAGTYTVPAKVYLDGEVGEAGAVGVYQVTVRVGSAGE